MNSTLALSQLRIAAGFSSVSIGKIGEAVNPLHPRHMSNAERRAEACGLFALGVIRLQAAFGAEDMA